MNIFELILDKYLTFFDCPDPIEVERLIKDQNQDGSFEDIPKINSNNEKPDFRFEFLERIKVLSMYYHFKRNTESLNGALNGLKWWVCECDFEKGYNWYYNSITIPRNLCDILILLGSDVDDYIKKKTIDRITYQQTDERYVYDIGANVLWTNLIKVHTACVLENKEMLNEAFFRINEELKMSSHHQKSDLVWRDLHWRTYVHLKFTKPTYEGIQDDYSFFEHGPMLQTGTYGMAYFKSAVKIIYESFGTEFFSLEWYNLIINYLLNHISWTLLGNRSDRQEIGVCGRSIAQLNINEGSPINEEKTLSLKQNIKLLCSLNLPYRRQELLEFFDNYNNNKDIVHGVKYFPKAKYLTMQSKGIKCAVRLTSCNEVASESVNWENIQGWHLGDGNMFCYSDNEEYKDIFKAYDWNRFPGLTAIQTQTKPMDYEQHISIKATSSKLCSGISYKNMAIASMELSKDDIHAYKTYIMLDGVAVALGSGIKAEKGIDVVTTIQQCHMKSDVLIDGNLMTGSVISGKFKCITHNKLNYCSLDKNEITVMKNRCIKNIFNITYKHTPEKPKEPLFCSNDLFTAFIDHGEFVEDSSYAYAVMPHNSRFNSRDLVVLRNDSSSQILEYKNYLFIAFWKSGSITEFGLKFKADCPCLIIADKRKILKSVCLNADEEEIKKKFAYVNN